MAKIQTVDYMAIPGQAASMRSSGQELNSQLTTAYQSTEEMHANWYGKRYNALIEEFNAIIPQLNEMLQLVVGDVPYALETIANNYSQADQGSAAGTATNTAPNNITEIPASNDVGMRFLTSEVENTKTNVSTNFDNAVQKMNEIESIFNTVTWESEAADAFREKFTSLKAQIIEAFENIKQQFTTLMTQAIEDVGSAESANTVS